MLIWALVFLPLCGKTFAGKGNNIGLLTSKITVFKDADSDPTSDLKDGVEAQTFLDRFTEIDHSHFCLGMFKIRHIVQ